MESLLLEEHFEVHEPSPLARVGGYVLLWTMVMLVCGAGSRGVAITVIRGDLGVGG